MTQQPRTPTTERIVGEWGGDRFYAWHHRACAIITYKAEVAVCDCGLTAAVLRYAATERADLVAQIEKALTPDYCDCDYEPVRGIAAGRHLPSCRYGIIEDFLDAAIRSAAPVEPSE